MKKLFLWALSALLTLPAAAQDFVPEASFYGENYWTPDTLGNHRAIVSVNTPASVAEAYIPWRRRDANPEQKGIIVINVSTGKAVDNVLPVEINREYGRIRFDASGNAGDYYVYYLPYHTSGGPYPKVNYPHRIRRIRNGKQPVKPLRPERRYKPSWYVSNRWAVSTASIRWKSSPQHRRSRY